MNPSRRKSSASGGRKPRSGSRKSSAPRSTPEPLKPIENPPDIENFDEWPGLGEDIQAAIRGMNITKPTPIQALSIGEVLAGRDMIAKAETGTGKTLAFGAPMMAKVDPSRRSVLGLVLSPTRELAEQVHSVLLELGASRGLSCALIVGGEPMQPQVKALQGGAQIVVGTPGRVLDLMNQGFLSFPWTEFAVLDEADKMLEIGFIDDVKKILDACSEYRQTLLFSATFPPPLLSLARAYTRDPLEVATSSGVSTAETVSQYYLEVGGDDKAMELRDLIRASGPDDVFLVFCDRRTDVDKLMRRLERERFSVKALHGGYDQASRFRVMDAFRTGEVKVLVATDVASRGLDVKHVTHVVNLNAPRDVSDYTHRIGRTGRAGREGSAVTFVAALDRRRWNDLERALPVTPTRISSVHDLFDNGPRKRRDGRDRAEESGGDRKPRFRREQRDGEERAPRREREERAPRREREDRGEGERPRRGGRNEGPQRRERDAERPRRDRDEERPRRERSREDRAPRERDAEPRRERAPRAHRERSPEAAPAEAPVAPERSERKPRTRRSESRPEAPLQERRGGSKSPRTPRPDADRGTPGGFGAGL
ncbi:MAG: DEAD/DEAH box helicase [Planctomycetota bacterium]